MDWFEEMIKQQKIKKDFQDKMQLSTDYIDWLESFTNIHDSFATDSFLYEPDAITKEDDNNISLLDALFEVIEEYANDNYITPEKADFELFYYIKHNDIVYAIGVNVGQGGRIFCVREEEPKENAIDYKQLMSTVKLPSTVQAEAKLEELEELLERLIEENVPTEAISRTTDTVIQKVKARKSE